MRAGSQSHFTIHPSRSLFWFLLTACGFLLVILSQFAWVFGWWISCALLVAGTCIFVTLRDARLQLAHSCIAFKLEDENRITLILSNGQHWAGDISSGGVVMPFLVILNIKSDEHGRKDLVLLPDSMCTDDFRRLCVLLRWSQKVV